MQLKAIILEGFRSYQLRTRIDLEALTAFIGKNDAGKSSVLEALEIFFNSEQIKFDRGDLCVHSKAATARIGCVFSEFPEELIIDARAKTTLKEEFLLNSDGDLEIHKIFDCSGKTNKEAMVAIAHHPTGKEVGDLLLKKNEELK